MPPKKKNQVNGFWLFAQKNKSAWKAQGLAVASNDQLLAIASPLWKSLSQDEKRRWDQRAKDERKTTKGNNADARRDNIGNFISAYKDPLEEAQRRREQDVNAILASWDKKDVTQEKFYFINFQDLCELTYGDSTTERQWLPREIALVEYSLAEGIMRMYHQFIWPGEPPAGYRLCCEETSEKFHKIPTEKMKEDSDDYRAIWARVTQFVSAGSSEGKYPPLYCLASDYKKVKYLCDWLWATSAGMLGRNDENPLSKVHALEDMVCQLLGASGRPGTQGISKSQICGLLDGYQWDYTPNTVCKFHEEQEVSKYCALAVVRKFAYTISDMVAQHYDITLTSQHVPTQAGMTDITVVMPSQAQEYRGADVRSKEQTPPKFNGRRGKRYPESGRKKTALGDEEDGEGYFSQRFKPMAVASDDQDWQPPERAEDENFATAGMSGLSLDSPQWWGGSGRDVTTAAPVPTGLDIPPGFEAVAAARGHLPAQQGMRPGPGASPFSASRDTNLDEGWGLSASCTEPEKPPPSTDIRTSPPVSRAKSIPGRGSIPADSAWPALPSGRGAGLALGRGYQVRPESGKTDNNQRRHVGRGRKPETRVQAPPFGRGYSADRENTASQPTSSVHTPPFGRGTSVDKDAPRTASQQMPSYASHAAASDIGSSVDQDSDNFVPKGDASMLPGGRGVGQAASQNTSSVQNPPFGRGVSVDRENTPRAVVQHTSSGQTPPFGRGISVDKDAPRTASQRTPSYASLASQAASGGSSVDQDSKDFMPVTPRGGAYMQPGGRGVGRGAVEMGRGRGFSPARGRGYMIGNRELF